ncbi:MAG: tRNA (guanosine(46)-N7)-methyltransferase TrmB [Bacteroidota bacterium]
MSRRNKLAKFAQLLSFPNVYENFDDGDAQLSGKDGEQCNLKGNWASGHFGNDKPIVLELACGRGEYCLALARKFPDKNFIGVDIKGARIWKGAKIALEEGLDNVAFIRTRIEQLTQFIGANEISEIWITFPDPFLRKPNRRLTAPPFLDRYRQMLQANAVVHLKTDSPELYEYTLLSVERYPHATLQYEDDDIYAKDLPIPELVYKTYYEKMHLAVGKTIKYIRFGLQALDPVEDQ